MDAHGRYSPWEVQESGINHAIRNHMSDYFQRLSPSVPRPRVCCEYDDITNVDGIKEILCAEGRAHPVDLAVLYPIKEVSGYIKKSGYAWAPDNCAALGLIEVKKDSGEAIHDVSRLSKIISLPSAREMPLQWVLFVVLIVADRESLINNALIPTGILELKTIRDPREAPNMPGSENISKSERWFDIRCYGKSREQA